MESGLNFWSVFSLLFFITAIPVAIMIILEKRSPFKTIAWVLALILLPVFGVIFYLFFGQEYRKKKLFSRKGLKSLSHYKQLSFRQLREFEQALGKLDPNVRRKESIIKLLLRNSSSLLTSGNKITILKDGKETYNAIFEAIEKAVHHVHLEYYILENDKIGNQLKELLIKKSKEGVIVRLIVDDVGSWRLNKKFIRDLNENGIEIHSFMEVRFPRLTSRANYRNHRKIVVVDGTTGFVGGANFADRYIEGIKKIGPWYDVHLQIDGNAAKGLQVVFSADWFFVTKENLAGPEYFPVIPETEGVPVQISASGPDSDWDSISQAFFAAITGARSKVYIVTPYLMPPQELVYALKTAALSNVDVKIIIPERSDSLITHWSSFSYIEDLLESRVRVYFFQSGFVHSKFIIVDNVFSTIGSTNLDFRSLETNFEVNAFIYDEGFNKEMKECFSDYLKMSREIKLAEWRKRKWHFKFRESLAHIISPLL